MLIAFLLLLVIGAVAANVYRIKRRQSKPDTPPVQPGLTFPYAFRWNISAPPHEVLIKNRNREIRARGLEVTADEAYNNSLTGGGPPDGGMYLAGYVEGVFDANLQVTGNAVIFGHLMPLSGGLFPDGTIGMAHIGGPIKGKMDMVTGKVTGTLHEGGGGDWTYNYAEPGQPDDIQTGVGREWVHGVLSNA